MENYTKKQLKHIKRESKRFLNYVINNLEFGYNDSENNYIKDLYKFSDDEDYYFNCKSKEEELLAEINDMGLLKRMSKSNNDRARLIAARKGVITRAMVNDEYTDVRYEVAKQGRLLKHLKNDPVFFIRCEVAKHGAFFNEMINDESVFVRKYALASRKKITKKELSQVKDLFSPQNYELQNLLAERGIMLEELLLKSESSMVKITLINKCYGLRKFMNDEDHWVRATVAEQGFMLDKFINDESHYVRKRVARQGYGLSKLVDNPDMDVLIEVAKQGYGLEYLSDSVYNYVRAEVAEQGVELEKLIKDDSPVVVRACIRGGSKDFDQIQDSVIEKSELLKFDLIRAGWNVERFLHDKSNYVKAELVKNGYFLDELIKNNSETVQLAFAEMGYYLDKLVDSKYDSVRALVANHGYALDKLITDKCYYVKLEALNYVLKEGLLDK